MTLALLIAAGAAAVAVIRGCSLQRVAETSFRWTWVLFAGLALQIGFEVWSPAWLSRGMALAVTLLSIGMVLVFLMANRSLSGMMVAAAGLGLNVIVIALNGAMPVSLQAAEVAGIDLSEFQTLGVKHEIYGPDTLAPWLADVLVVPNTQQIFSVGDVVLGLGLGILVYTQAQPGTKARHAIR